MNFSENFVYHFNIEMETLQPVPELRDVQELLFDPLRFANSNGNKVVANVLLTLAAAKLMAPEIDTRCFSDGRGLPQWVPSLRSLSKHASRIARERFDVSLLSHDPMAGARRSLQYPAPYNSEYGGSFNDDTIRRIFLYLVDLIEEGEAGLVFRMLLNGYKILSYRLAFRSVVTTIDNSTGIDVVRAFLENNSAARMQTIVWAVAHELDPSVQPIGELNGNDTHHRVADVRGEDYAIEAKAEHLSLGMIENTLAKARAAGCYRVRFVSIHDAVFRADDRKRIVDIIGERFPDINSGFISLREFLMNAVALGGKVTWQSILNRIGLTLRQFQPYEYNTWSRLVENIVDGETRSCYFTDHAEQQRGDPEVFEGLCTMFENAGTQADRKTAAPRGRKPNAQSFMEFPITQLLDAVSNLPEPFNKTDQLLPLIEAARAGRPVSKTTLSNLANFLSGAFNAFTSAGENASRTVKSLQLAELTIREKDRAHKAEVEVARLQLTHAAN